MRASSPFTLAVLAALAAFPQVACLDSRPGSTVDPDGTTDSRDDARSDTERDSEGQRDDVPSTLDAWDGYTPDLADSQSLQDTEPTLDAGRDSSPDFIVDADCATAVIGVSPGLNVVPSSLLQLTGSQSFGDGVEIVSYRWEVDQPIGSVSTFMPSSHVANPRFETNVAGVYNFRLFVRDAYGTESCAPAQVTVFANPVGGIHIELLWDTPGDVDQTDTGNDAGSDFDLHLLHPYAVGGFDGDGDGIMDGWFDSPFDVFWDNPSPNWGYLDPAIDDDPILTMDDTDGAGPELIDLANPELGRIYTVGVHYWYDRGLGNSFATLRIYLNGSLAFELANVELEHGDMWPAARIHWTESPWVELIKRCEGTHLECSGDADCGGSDCRPYTLPNYRPPEYFTP